MKTRHLKRYKEIAQLFWKYGRSDVLAKLAEADLPAADAQLSPDDEKTAHQLAADLEAMGPTYVKLGQVLSSRADLLPEPYLIALSKLQDKVAPFPFAEVEQIVQKELGVRLSKAFASFDSEPLAAASLGQVHRATLRDGRPVVVKVQRPNVREQIPDDLEVLHEIAAFLRDHTPMGRRYSLVRVVDEFERRLLQELDYEREAVNLKTLAHNLKEFPRLRIPLPIESYTTRSVLTMEYIAGQKITDIGPLVSLEVNASSLADELFTAYLKQVLVDGLFHADPHPGNILLTDDYCIGLLDLGMIGRVSPRMQEQLLKLLFAVSEGRGDEAATVAIDIGEKCPDFDEAGFREKVGIIVIDQRDATLDRMDIGRTVIDVGRVAGASGLVVPTELILLGKTLMQLHQIGRQLDPQFDPNAAIRRHLAEFVNRRWRQDLTPGHLLSVLAEAKDFVRYLPAKVSKALDSLAQPNLEVRVRPDDTKLFLAGMQKIANRIAAGLVLSALIVGAALLMRVETSFQIMGYPGFAILCFLGAGGGGFWLLLDIFLHDRRDRRSAGNPKR